VCADGDRLPFYNQLVTCARLAGLSGLDVSSRNKVCVHLFVTFLVHSSGVVVVVGRWVAAGLGRKQLIFMVV
jgi:hypothetical protein